MKALDFFPPKAQEKAITEYLQASDHSAEGTALAKSALACAGVKRKTLNKGRSTFLQDNNLLYQGQKLSKKRYI